MIKQRYYSWNDYYIPGTTTLRNKFVTANRPFGEPDAQILRAKEETATTLRAGELRLHPIRGSFDYQHMKAIHYHLFQDVYEWAGQERTAPDTFMAKGYADVVDYPPGDPNAPWRTYYYYPAGPALTEAAEHQFSYIRDNDYFRGLASDEFISALAESWGEINTIHPFREGNTRTQFIFYSQLCAHAGYKLNEDLLAPGKTLIEDFVAARFYSQATGSNTRLAKVLGKAITPLRPPLPGIGEVPQLKKLDHPTRHVAPKLRQSKGRNHGYGRGM